MRKLFMAALLGAALAAAPAAQAQSSSYVGTWAFQNTGTMIAPGAMRTLSGAAIIRRAGRGYDIRLLAHEVESGPQGAIIISAVNQRCRGETEGSQLTITCAVIDGTENYSPDNFVVHFEDGRLVGTFVSNRSSSVVFTRVN